MIKSKDKIIRFLFLLASPLATIAQKPDSLAPIREFLQISSAYQQPPLYLEIEMKNTTNFTASEEDTSVALGKFYLLPGSSYIQLGEVEQFVTDSIALLVNSKMQRIIVNTRPGPWRDRMETLSGSMLKKSSIMELSKKYSGQSRAMKDVSIIELNSRSLLRGTSIPTETIEMQFDSQTKKPGAIGFVKRMLVPLSSEDFQTLRSQPGMEKFLFTVEDKGYYLIKEQTTSFAYKAVVQDAKIKIPFSVSDRIVRNNNGDFKPVHAYQDYEITTN